MADYSDIIREINSNIPDNNTQYITAGRVRSTLIDMINAVKQEEDIMSGMIYQKQDLLDFDQEPTQGSKNPVTSGGVFEVVRMKQDILSFDLEPTVSSNNPVTSGGVYTALESKANKSEMIITPGTGVDADKTTIQLKTGTTATVLTQHQDTSDFITKTVNDLTNYYLKSETYTQTEVNALIGAIQQFHYEIYQTLPSSGESNVLYLIGPTGTGSDRYDEYVYANNVFTKIGDTSIDLSGYVTTSALNTALASYTPTSNLAAVATSGDYEDLINTPDLDNVVPIIYGKLKHSRDEKMLVPGIWYRITDYICTTTQENTRSADHAFDIIVRADDESHLNENAFAAHHEEDRYFADCKLEAWELKYCLDNDTDRFAWADKENGTGVIFYMKDEWNNECPYDFKNIMFKRWAVTEVMDSVLDQDTVNVLNGTFVFDGDKTKFQARFGYQENNCTYGSTTHVVDAEDSGWYYTFSIIEYDVDNDEYSIGTIEDGSIKGNKFYNDEDGGGFYGNSMKPFYNNMASDESGIDGAQVLNNIVFNGYYENNAENPYIYGCNNNSFGSNCYDNTFGKDCRYNTFGNYCIRNTFRDTCYNNSFGNSCWNNSFGTYCIKNTFGNECYNNSFGNGCTNNTFGNEFQSNSFGNNCRNNTFWNTCYSNLFGKGCTNNTIGNEFQSNTFGNYCQNITVFDGVWNCRVTGGSQIAPVMNAQILNGTAGTSVQSKLTITFAANKKYTQVAGLVNGTTLRIWIDENTVTGPQTAVNHHIAVFDGTTGKTIKDSGISVSDLLLELATPVTYSELKELRDDGELVPGTWYRITDYTCTTTQENTQSANHTFDIIVRADDEEHLNENAFAAHHGGDTYFADCKLEAWELKYCLDNDTNRFAWAFDGYSVSDISNLKVPYETLPNELKIVIEQGMIDYNDDDCGFFLFEVQQSETYYVFSHDGGQSLNIDFTIVLSNDTRYTIGDSIQILNMIQNNSEETTIMEINGSEKSCGTGVIFYMKDEWNNECPYDFKNILFERCKITECLKSPDLIGLYAKDGAYGITVDEQKFMVPTFCMIDLGEGTIHDVSVEQDVYLSDDNFCHKTNNNHISDYIDGFQGDDEQFHYVMILPDVVFVTDTEICDIEEDSGVFYAFSNNCFGRNCRYITLGNDYNGNTFGNECNGNTFGNNCSNNTFGNNCSNNTFGNGCNGNTFGNNCSNNTFGNGDSNIFGNNCGSNTFGNNCSNNTFGSDCSNNTFGNGCSNNAFGVSCGNNTFGNYCAYNMFGNGCYRNSFGNEFQNNTFGNHCRNITAFDGVKNCNLTGGTSGAPIKNAQILNGTAGASAQNKLTITFAANKNYTQVAAKTTEGNLKIFTAALTLDNTPTANSDNPVTSGGVYTALEGKADKITVTSIIPPNGLVSNKLYIYGVLSQNTTFVLSAATDNTIANIWMWTFETGATAPTITWPQDITAWNGGEPPIIAENYHYEITVMDGVASFIEAPLPQTQGGE